MTIKRRISLKVQEPSHILNNDAKTHPQAFRAIKKAETRLKLSSISSPSLEHHFALTSTPNTIDNQVVNVNQTSAKVTDEDFPYVLQLDEHHVPFQSKTHFLNNIGRRSSNSLIGSNSDIHGEPRIPESILMPDLDHD